MLVRRVLYFSVTAVIIRHISHHAAAIDTVGIAVFVKGSLRQMSLCEDF